MNRSDQYYISEKCLEGLSGKLSYLIKGMSDIGSLLSFFFEFGYNFRSSCSYGENALSKCQQSLTPTILQSNKDKNPMFN